MSGNAHQMNPDGPGFAGRDCVSELREFEGTKESREPLSEVDDGISCGAGVTEPRIEGLGEASPKESPLRSGDHVESVVMNGNDGGVHVKANAENREYEIAVGPKDEFVGINLTVELHSPRNEDNGSKNVEEKSEQNSGKVKTGQTFGISDLVWGKVRSHPWWPGQIFDSSAASVEARKYFKKDRFLIAYFGDQTFAWNDAASIKPFRDCFSRMENQSNLDSFCHAVDCALDELSRRVEYGLACQCLPKVVYEKIRNRRIVNAGIRDESSDVDGSDSSWRAASFEPVRLVKFVKDLAVSPLSGADRLEFVVKRASLLAVSRWKGYDHLPEYNTLDFLLDDEDDTLLGEEKHGDELTKNVAPESHFYHALSSMSGKQKGKGDCLNNMPASGGLLHSDRKERSLSDLMAKLQLQKLADETGSEKKSSNKSSSSLSGKKRTVRSVISDDSDVKSKRIRLKGSDSKSTETKQFSSVGDKIRKVVSELKKSKPPRGRPRGTSVRESKIVSQKSNDGSIELVVQQSPPEEMLSQLCLMARNPTNSPSLLIPFICFFSKFRDSFILENAPSDKQDRSLEQVGTVDTLITSTHPMDAESMDLQYLRDSYWTDRIIQSDPEVERAIGTPKREGLQSYEPGTTLKFSPSFACDGEKKAVEPIETTNMSDRGDGDLTALILKFTSSDSIPAEDNLNKIFRRFGPLKESETEVFKKTNRAKIVFKRRTDAEAAFSSAGKYSIFGPSLVSYRLKYVRPKPSKSSSHARKRSKKMNDVD